MDSRPGPNARARVRKSRDLTGFFSVTRRDCNRNKSTDVEKVRQSQCLTVAKHGMLNMLSIRRFAQALIETERKHTCFGKYAPNRKVIQTSQNDVDMDL